MARKPPSPVLPQTCPGCGVVFKARQHGKKYCTARCQHEQRLKPETAIASFWSKVDRRGDHECWGWKAQKRWDGYGRFVYKYRPRWAHRFSYELHHGPIPEGMHVLHTCDNPECTNPAHLRLGTHGDNMRDMTRKDRAFAKIKTSQVPEIRRRLSAGERPEDIAPLYGVAPTAIWDIKRGDTWKMVP